MDRIAEKRPYRSYNIELPDHSLRRRTSRHIRFAPDVSIHEFDNTNECGPTISVPSKTAAARPTSDPGAAGREPISASTAATANATAAVARPNSDYNGDVTARKNQAAHSSAATAAASAAYQPPPTSTTKSGRIIRPPARYRDN